MHPPFPTSSTSHLPPSHDGKSLEELVAAHDPEEIRRRLDAGLSHSYLKDFVYGAIDGAVTTFAVVSGVAGAGLSSGIVVILGTANLIGDGFSMAAGNFLGTRAEQQQRDRLRRMEERHIDEVPEGEREELRQIFAHHGFVGKDLEHVVDVLSADRQRWVDIMLREEHGLAMSVPSPIKAAAATFAAFVLIGLLPLLPFLLNLVSDSLFRRPYVWSSAVTAGAFFAVGTIKSRFVDQHWLRAGLETLLVGGTAAGLSFLCGVLLAGIAKG
jgi:VIT1/CCC1 family predicted Fe2+/Mn2+ transporter